MDLSGGSLFHLPQMGRNEPGEGVLSRGMPFQGEEHRWTETLSQASVKLVEKKNMFEGWRK